MRKHLLLSVVIGLFFFSCKNKEVTHVFEVNNETVYLSNIEKTKQKTAEQFISILYTNLYNTPIPADELLLLAEFRRANGDKQLVDELILNNYVNSGAIDIPTDAGMRQNVDQFIIDTYVRFFLREPNAYEKRELKKQIEEDEGLSPALIFQAFALSNEYKYY